MKRMAMMVGTVLLLGGSAALAQTTPGGASTSADPAASTTQTGLSRTESTAQPDATGSKSARPGSAQPANAVPMPRDTTADPHSGRNNPAGPAASGTANGG